MDREKRREQKRAYELTKRMAMKLAILSDWEELTATIREKLGERDIPIVERER